MSDQQKAFAAAIEGFAKAQGPAALASYAQIAHWMGGRANAIPGSS